MDSQTPEKHQIFSKVQNQSDANQIHQKHNAPKNDTQPVDVYFQINKKPIDNQYSLYELRNCNKSTGTKLATQEQFQWGKWNLNDQRNQRFSFLIFGGDRVLRNVNSFQKLFSDIKYHSSIKHIELSFEEKLPSQKLEGAIIEINDFSEEKIHIALVALLQNFSQIYRNLASIYWRTTFTLNIVLPRMLIPLIMGKQGRILNKIKELTQCIIKVHGPYSDHNHQNIEIFSTRIEDICQASMMMYSLAFKLLKCQPIMLKQGWMNDSIECKAGILISSRVYQKVYVQYKNYIHSLWKNLQIQYEILDYKSSRSKSRQRSQYIFMAEGKVSQVKILLNHFIRLIWYEGHLEDQIIYILNKNHARNITSLGGKVIRDLSSRSGYAFMQVLEKDEKFNRLVVRGRLEDLLKAVCVISEFICFDERIIQQQQGKQKFKYQNQLKAMKKVFQPGWINHDDEKDEDNQDTYKKTKKIQKFFHNYRKPNYPYFRKPIVQKGGSFNLTEPRIIQRQPRQSIENHIVASILTEHMNDCY